MNWLGKRDELMNDFRHNLHHEEGNTDNVIRGITWVLRYVLDIIYMMSAQNCYGYK